MDMALYEKAQKNFGLKADSASFLKALNVSQFLRAQVESLVEVTELDPFKAQLALDWMPLFDDGIEESWLSAEVSKVFDLGDAEEPLLARAMARLRCLRNLFQARSIYRECASFGQVSAAYANADGMFIAQMAEYSLFADVVFAQSEAYLRQRLMDEWGVKGAMPALTVLGLGKLGAGELNLSSDVDLIFCFNHLTTLESQKDRSASEFYTALGQRLIKFLGEITPEGFVFRVDMRLRPFGQSGALVWSTQAIETYYQQQGRMWERYAWIKTRVLTGGADADRLLSNLKQFVYRRYVDFGVIEALREMKSLIAKEVNRKEGGQNIKIGRGGIREVEFIVQVIQLIRGGELCELQQPSLMEALSEIDKLGVLPSAIVRELRSDYLYLRRVEHFLQAFNDRQTQTLPASDDDWHRLVVAMEAESQDSLMDEITQVRDRIHFHFQETIRPPEAEQKFPEGTEYWESIWPDNIQTLEDPLTLEMLHTFQSSRCVEKASEIAKQRLNALMPTLLAMLQTVAEQETIAQESTMSHQLDVSLPELDLYWAGVHETLRRLLLIIEAILRRSAYMSLLSENPQALYKVVKLCSTSALMPEKLAAYPSLLDEFVDDTPVYKPPSRDTLTDELRQQLVRIPEDDFEQQMARLRAFKQRHTLRAAVADIAGQLPLMHVSDYLTWLAEALLEAALEIAWRKLVLRYGEPERYPGSRTGFLIVGYGKLGGIELSYTSDLDIVFLYDVPEDGETEGPKVIENSVFYLQLVKNLNHILMTDTLDGRLYEIDLRLRPSGSAGLFVSTFEGFQRYQEKDAWVWERQALVRARPVAGDVHLFSRFNAMRAVSLMSMQPSCELAESVLEMRDKMKSHLTSRKGKFDLKYGAGGLVDIEFIAQHLVLHCGANNPAVTKYSDNVRIFDLAKSEGVLSETESEALTQAYLLYRAVIHRLSLQKKDILIDENLLADMRKSVVDILERWFSRAKEGESL